MKICTLSKYISFIFIFNLLLTFSASAAVIFVDVNASGANTGASWADAYISLQSALSTANNGDQIWVAAGTYSPTHCSSNISCTTAERSASFNITKNISLYGGFAGTETSIDQRNLQLYKTILSGDLLGNDITDRTDLNYVSSHLDNSYHIVTGNAVSFLMDGFTIYGGYNECDASSLTCIGATGVGVRGAGLYYQNGNVSNSITLKNITFNDNYLNGFQAGFPSGGAAAYILNASASATNALTLNIDDSAIINNHAKRWISGIFGVNTNANVKNTIFDSNRIDTGSSTASLGAAHFNNSTNAIITVNVDDSTFSNNFGNSAPGALIVGGINLNVNHTSFINNTITGESRGGALFLDSRSSTTNTTVSNCLFQGNHAPAAGAIAFIGVGTVGSLKVDNTKFIDNVSTATVPIHNVSIAGGAIANFDNPNMTITNSLFQGNSGFYDGGAIVIWRSATNPANAPYLSNIQLDNNKFINNSTQTGNGGAISDQASLNPVISNSLFEGNTAGTDATPGNGGAINVINKGVLTGHPAVSRTITLSNNKFLNNNATNGGAVSMVQNNSTLNLSLETLTMNIDNHSKFVNNTALQNGGAIYQVQGTMNVVDSMLKTDNALNGSEIYIQLPATTNGQTLSADIINALINANSGLQPSSIFINP